MTDKQAKRLVLNWLCPPEKRFRLIVEQILNQFRMEIVDSQLCHMIQQAAERELARAGVLKTEWDKVRVDYDRENPGQINISYTRTAPENLLQVLLS